MHIPDTPRHISDVFNFFFKPIDQISMIHWNFLIKLFSYWEKKFLSNMNQSKLKILLDFWNNLQKLKFKLKQWSENQDELLIKRKDLILLLPFYVERYFTKQKTSCRAISIQISRISKKSKLPLLFFNNIVKID
jgi:hypothetical protein